MAGRRDCLPEALRPHGGVASGGGGQVRGINGQGWGRQYALISGQLRRVLNSLDCESIIVSLLSLFCYWLIDFILLSYLD